MTVALPFVVLSLNLGSVATCAKPTVGISQMLPRATHIVVGKVLSDTVVFPVKRAPGGDWLQERRRVTVQLDQVLKTDDEHEVQKEFAFEVESLVFEKGATYVFFLKVAAAASTDGEGKEPTVRFEHIGNPVSRVDATKAVIKQVKGELEKSNTANKAR